MEAILTSVVLAGLVLLLISFPHLKAHFKDVSDLALVNQSSISTTRKEGESAVYRSVDVPHGLPLNTGLRIRENYSIRDGFLNDIWLNTIIDLKETNRLNERFIKIEENKISIGKLNYIIHELSGQLKKMSFNKSIGLYAPIYKLGSISLITCCFFMNDLGIKLVKINGKVDDFRTKENLSKLDCDVVFTLSEYASFFTNLKDVKKVVIIDDIDNDNDKVIRFKDLVDLDDLKDKLEYDFKPDYPVTNQIYTEFNLISGERINYFQRNFISTISSQLMSLPIEHNWKEEDNLLIVCDDKEEDLDNSIHFNSNLIKLLSGLLMCLNSITLLPYDLINEIEDFNKSSIMVLGKKGLEYIENRQFSDINLWDSFKLNRSKLLFSNGIYNQIGLKNKLFKNLRIIYIYNDNNNKLKITSEEYNKYRSLFGSRIINERLTKGIIGSILKTNFYDYRVIEGEIKNKFRLIGVASNSVEIKTREIDNKLYIRGFNIGKEEGIDNDMYIKEEGWKPLEIYGKFGNDGCFYEFVN